MFLTSHKKIIFLLFSLPLSVKTFSSEWKKISSCATQSHTTPLLGLYISPLYKDGTYKTSLMEDCSIHCRLPSQRKWVIEGSKCSHLKIEAYKGIGYFVICDSLRSIEVSAHPKSKIYIHIMYKQHGTQWTTDKDSSSMIQIS